MSQPKTTRIPAPLYAAAGAGEMAYRQLLKLPAYANDLSGKAVNNGAELREQVLTQSVVLRDRANAAFKTANDRAVKFRSTDLDLDRLRDLAMRNAATFIAGAQAAQDRAISVYGQLVAHGEKVVGTGVVQAADTVNADMELTEELPAASKPAAKKAPAKKSTPTN